MSFVHPGNIARVNNLIPLLRNVPCQMVQAFRLLLFCVSGDLQNQNFMSPDNIQE